MSFSTLPAFGSQLKHIFQHTRLQKIDNEGSNFHHIVTSLIFRTFVIFFIYFLLRGIYNTNKLFFY